MDNSTYNTTVVVIYSISAVIALLMLWIAIRQLSKVASQIEVAAKANSLSQLSALLNLEQQIADRRLELSKAGIAIAQVRGSPGEEFDSAKLRFNEAKEMYLNSLERLCFCVLRDLFHDDDIRLEYRDVIRAALTDFASDFGDASPYRNIRKVHNRWADQ